MPCRRRTPTRKGDTVSGFRWFPRSGGVVDVVTWDSPTRRLPVVTDQPQSTGNPLVDAVLAYGEAEATAAAAAARGDAEQARRASRDGLIHLGRLMDLHQHR